MPLYLSESDVVELVDPAAAVDAIEACFRRMAAGEVEIAPRRRLRLPEGSLADMAAADSGLGLAGGKLYAATSNGVTFVVCLFDSESSELVAVIEADRLGQLRTGAASGVAARHLARSGAQTLGVIGCGHQAETQVACVRAAMPSIERVVAYCRTPEKLAAFCERMGAEPGESHRDAAENDVVVTITSSRDPVLRGEWLAPRGAGLRGRCQRRQPAGARQRRARAGELRLLRLARAGAARVGRPDRAGSGGRPRLAGGSRAARGRRGEVAGRQSDGDIVVFKSNGLAAWDVALGAEAVRRAREQGVVRTTSVVGARQPRPHRRSLLRVLDPRRPRTPPRSRDGRAGASAARA